MKIVFMGTPHFAVPSLQKLLDAHYDIAAVVTQPDRKSGRGHRLAASPVKMLAQQHGIPVLQFEKIKSEQGVAALEEIAPELIVTAAFGQILSKRILDIPHLGCINVHASLLPRYRGAAPVQWAIIKGEKYSGVTIMYMNEGLDTGDIISSEAVPIGEETTGGALYDTLAETGAALLIDTLKAIKNHTADRTAQNEAEASYYPPLSRDMGAIDWCRPAKEIRDLARALDPVMGAYTQMGGHTFKIWAADAVQGSAAPGRVVCANAKDGLAVGTGQGLLRVRAMQAPGSRRMTPEEYLRGKSLPGERFE